jgi:hypothetical protein
MYAKIVPLKNTRLAIHILEINMGGKNIYCKKVNIEGGRLDNVFILFFRFLRIIFCNDFKNHT